MTCVHKLKSRFTTVP